MFVIYTPNRESLEQENYVLKELEYLVKGKEYVFRRRQMRSHQLGELRQIIEHFYSYCYVDVLYKEKKLVIYSSRQVLAHIDENFSTILDKWGDKRYQLFLDLQPDEYNLLIHNKNQLLSKFEKHIKYNNPEIYKINLESKSRNILYIDTKIKEINDLCLAFHNFKLFLYFSISPDELKNYPRYLEKNRFENSIDLSDTPKKLKEDYKKSLEKGTWIQEAESKTKMIQHSRYEIVEDIKKKSKFVESHTDKGRFSDKK